MPTTELISIGALSGPFTSPLQVFAQRCDSKLVSDRGLFQPVLDRLAGTIIHLGDPSHNQADPVWFCGHCLEYRLENDDGHHIGYTTAAITELRQLLSSLQNQSPEKHVLFLTDYQFGPEAVEIVTLGNIDEFVALSDSRNIRFNTLYSIGMSIESSRFWDYYPRAAI
jgi:hypothetical protein